MYQRESAKICINADSAQKCRKLHVSVAAKFALVNSIMTIKTNYINQFSSLNFFLTFLSLPLNFSRLSNRVNFRNIVISQQRSELYRLSDCRALGEFLFKLSNFLLEPSYQEHKKLSKSSAKYRNYLHKKKI